MIITIDGPAGAGKSTVAKKLAAALGYVYVDTGAMYRALTLKAVRSKTDFADIPALIRLAGSTTIALRHLPTGQTDIMLDGKDVSAEIRDPAITNAVFHVARIAEIRRIMAQWQREYGLSENIVMEGRDIGTVIFPGAEIKFYLDASPEIRAQRRFRELREKGVALTLEQVMEQIKDRDHKDRTRSCAPLKKADDAIYIDSSDHTIEGVITLMLKHCRHEKK